MFADNCIIDIYILLLVKVSTYKTFSFEKKSYLCLLTVHLFTLVGVPVCLCETCFSVSSLLTLWRDRQNLAEAHHSLDIHIPLVFWQHISQERSKVVLKFLSLPFDFKDWILWWQNMHNFRGGIRATLKLIPRVKCCLLTKRNKDTTYIFIGVQIVLVSFGEKWQFILNWHLWQLQLYYHFMLVAELL